MSIEKSPMALKMRKLAHKHIACESSPSAEEHTPACDALTREFIDVGSDHFRAGLEHRKRLIGLTKQLRKELEG